MASTGAVPAACCLLLTLFGCASPSPLFLQEGAACLGGGRCARVRHCPSALEAIRRDGPLPRRCGFSGLEEVVCCPADVTGRDGDDTGRDIDASGNDITPGDAAGAAAAIACADYKKRRNELEDYILGGKMAAVQEFPHMAALGYKVPSTEGVSWLCGGTLISDQFVLTAAHCCASRVTGQPVSVRLGSLAPTSEAAGGSEYSVSAVVMHPGYRRRQHHSDIALLRLGSRVPLSDAVFPACLDTSAADTADLLAAGWGATNAAGTRASSVLMKTTISPFPLSDCQRAYKDKFPGGLNSSVICAGDPQGKTDTCVGDSGGPLVTGSAAPYTVVGITSLGPKPCGGTVPSIYTRVSSYVAWVEQLVWP